MMVVPPGVELSRDRPRLDEVPACKTRSEAQADADDHREQQDDLLIMTSSPAPTMRILFHRFFDTLATPNWPRPSW